MGRQGDRLSVDEITVRFGGVVALDRVSMAVEPGSIAGLIGPNGAGKTTLFNCISRLVEPASGSITLGAVDVRSTPPHRIVDIGIARTYQHASLFPDLTVLDNVLVGAHGRQQSGLLRSLVPIGLASGQRRDVDTAMQLLERLDLDHLALLPARGLPYGTLKRIEIARALAAEPQLLLLDEPAGGLTHSEVDELATTIRRLRDEFGLTVLLVEHHMALVMGISDWVTVLDMGTNLASGTPAEVTAHPDVIRAYLGRRA